MADQLRAAAERVLHNPSFTENSRKIGDSLKEREALKKRQMKYLNLNDNFRLHQNNIIGFGAI